MFCYELFIIVYFINYIWYELLLSLYNKFIEFLLVFKIVKNINYLHQLIYAHTNQIIITLTYYVLISKGIDFKYRIK